MPNEPRPGRSRKPELNREFANLYTALARYTPPCASDPTWDSKSLLAQRKVCRASCELLELCRAAADSTPLTCHGTWGGLKYPQRPTVVAARQRKATNADT